MLNCTEILGNLTIRGEGIKNLDSLSGLTLIGSDLWIGGNPTPGGIQAANDSLVSLIGLDSLKTVVGSWGVYFNL